MKLKTLYPMDKIIVGILVAGECILTVEVSHDVADDYKTIHNKSIVPMLEQLAEGEYRRLAA